MRDRVLRPFFGYYGSKWRLAGRLPAPEHDLVVDAFCGSAGYPLRHPRRRVVLCDSSPVVAGVWRYLLRASEREVLALPDLEPGQSVSDLRVPQEARWLIGFWLARASPNPRQRPSAWMRAGRWSGFWGPAVRARIARQLAAVRHWRVVHGDYREVERHLPRVPATWFVDPPYSSSAGRAYRSAPLDYLELAAWCRSRPGLVIACEGEGARWLPFRPVGEIRGVRRRSVEAACVLRDGVPQGRVDGGRDRALASGA